MLLTPKASPFVNSEAQVCHPGVDSSVSIMLPTDNDLLFNSSVLFGQITDKVIAKRTKRLATNINTVDELNIPLWMRSLLQTKHVFSSIYRLTSHFSKERSFQRHALGVCKVAEQDYNEDLK
jgi:hypothetical protein